MVSAYRAATYPACKPTIVSCPVRELSVEMVAPETTLFVPHKEAPRVDERRRCALESARSAWFKRRYDNTDR